MVPYPPLYTKEEAGNNSLLRVLGGVMALLGIVLALLGIVFHQGVADLVIGILVGLLALRVLILWLGDKAHTAQTMPAQQPYPHMAAYRGQPSPYTPPYAGQPAPYAGPAAHPPAPYSEPSIQPQSFYEERTQAIPPPAPMGVAQPVTEPRKLPRSVRPQRPPEPEKPLPTRFIAPVQPPPPLQIEPPALPVPVAQTGAVPQLASEWLAPADASVPALPSAPVPPPGSSIHWQYDDGSDAVPQEGMRGERDA